MHSPVRIKVKRLYVPWYFGCADDYFNKNETPCWMPGFTAELYKLLLEASHLSYKTQLYDKTRNSYDTVGNASDDITDERYSIKSKRYSKFSFILPPIHYSGQVLVINPLPRQPLVSVLSPIQLSAWIYLAVCLVVTMIWLYIYRHGFSKKSFHLINQVENILGVWFELHFAQRSEQKWKNAHAIFIITGWSTMAFVCIRMYKTIFVKHFTAPAEISFLHLQTRAGLFEALSENAEYEPVCIKRTWSKYRWYLHNPQLRDMFESAPPPQMWKASRALKHIHEKPGRFVLGVTDLYVRYFMHNYPTLHMVKMLDSSPILTSIAVLNKHDRQLSKLLSAAIGRLDEGGIINNLRSKYHLQGMKKVETKVKKPMSMKSYASLRGLMYFVFSVIAVVLWAELVFYSIKNSCP